MILDAENGHDIAPLPGVSGLSYSVAYLPGHDELFATSFDGNFLFTVGQDGNFFTFRVMDEDKMQEKIAEARAKIPSAKVGILITPINIA